MPEMLLTPSVTIRSFNRMNTPCELKFYKPVPIATVTKAIRGMLDDGHTFPCAVCGQLVRGGPATIVWCAVAHSSCVSRQQKEADADAEA